MLPISIKSEFLISIGIIKYSHKYTEKIDEFMSMTIVSYFNYIYKIN